MKYALLMALTLGSLPAHGDEMIRWILFFTPPARCIPTAKTLSLAKWMELIEPKGIARMQTIEKGRSWVIFNHRSKVPTLVATDADACLAVQAEIEAHNK